MPHAVVAFDSDGFIQFRNESFEQILGYSPQRNLTFGEFCKELALILENPEAVDNLAHGNGQPGLHRGPVLELKDGRRIECLDRSYSDPDRIATVARLIILTEVGDLDAVPAGQVDQ
jgi:PAS domain-containing protein